MNQELRIVEFDGFTWELCLPSNVDTEIAAGRWWDIEVHDWICAHVTPGMICVDAGANIGAFSMLMARCASPGGTVYAFEPCPAFVQRLRRHIELNQIANVSVQECAMGDKCGPGLCFQDGPPYYSTAHVDMRCSSNQARVGVTAVQVITLDTFFLTRKAPGFLKIDVDGSELAVLEGARFVIEHAKPIVAIEVPLGEEGVEMAGWLADRGYTLRTGQGARPRPCDFGFRTRGTKNVLALPDSQGTWNEEM